MGFLEDLGNFGKSLIEVPVKFVNTGINQANEGFWTLKGQYDMMTNNRNALAEDLRQQANARKAHDNGGLFGMGSLYSSRDAYKGDLMTGVQKIGGGTLETMASVVPFAKGGSVAIALGKGGIKSAAPKLLAQGALYGGMYSAGNQLRNNGNIDAGRLARDTAIGSVANLAVPAAFRGAGNAVNYGLQKGVNAYGNKLAMPMQATLNQMAKTNPNALVNMAKNAQPVTRAPIAAGAVNANAKPSPVQEAAMVNKAATAAQQKGVVANTKAALPKQEIPPLYDPTNAVANRFTTRGKAGDQNISDEVMGKISGEHVVRNTKALVANGEAEAAKYKSTNKLVEAAHQRMSVRPGSITDQDISFISQAIQRADMAGNHEAASLLHDALSEHAVAAGQRVQAMSIFYNRTPEGLFNKAIRDIKRANGKDFQITPELRDELKTLTQAIKDAPNQDAKEFAIASMQKLVQKNVPQSSLQGALSVWKAGLLSSPVTHAGNAMSNFTFGALKKASDVPAVLADMGLAKFGRTDLGQKLGLSGERTRSFTLAGEGSGFKTGLDRGLETMKTGIDRRNIVDGKYEGHGEITFDNKWLQNVFGKPSNMVFRALGSGDQPFYYAALKNSLSDQAKTAGINQGLKGAELKQFIKQTVEKPPKQMANRAEQEAWYAVLGEDRKISSNLSSFVSKHPAMQAVVPFTKVPTNFLAQVLDYTPVGATSKLVQAVQKARAGEGIDQRLLTEAIGKSTTGTGIIFIGANLAGAGMLSGTYPSDPKEQARWKAEGITPNSIKIGDTWYSLNYAGPIGMLMQAGKDYNDAAARGDNATMQSIAGIGKSLTGQSFLTGFSGFANALNDPGRYGEKLINQQAGSVVPNWLNVTANATDQYQRDINSPLDAIQSRIPGARQGLNIKQDVYGNPLEQRTDSFNLLFNPLRPSNSRSSTTLAEVGRLHNADVNNKDFQVTPVPVDQTISLDGQKLKLSDQQRYELQNLVGQMTQQQWELLITSPQYMNLNDTDKASALTKLKQDAAAIAQRYYVEKNNLGTFKKDLTNSQKNLMVGMVSASDYAKSGSDSPSGGASTVAISSGISPAAQKTLKDYNAMSKEQRTKLFDTQNDAEFKYNLAKYENDVASGKLSASDKIKAEDQLYKDKVGSNFSKEARELYGLSKVQLAKYVEKNPDKQKIVQEAIAYGNALVEAGLAKSNKFGGGGRGGTRRGGRGGGGGRSKQASASRSGEISTVAAGTRAAAKAKVAGTSAGGFQNKISRPGLQAYKKTSKTTVRSSKA